MSTDAEIQIGSDDRGGEALPVRRVYALNVGNVISALTEEILESKGFTPETLGHDTLEDLLGILLHVFGPAYTLEGWHMKTRSFTIKEGELHRCLGRLIETMAAIQRRIEKEIGASLSADGNVQSVDGGPGRPVSHKIGEVDLDSAGVDARLALVDIPLLRGQDISSVDAKEIAEVVSRVLAGK